MISVAREEGDFNHLRARLKKDIGRVPLKGSRTMLLRSPCHPKAQREEIESTTSFAVTTALA